MRNEKFIVVFTNHNFEVVIAGCKDEAIILAQAKQIKKGNSHNVEFVKNKDGVII